MGEKIQVSHDQKIDDIDSKMDPGEKKGLFGWFKKKK